MSSAVITIDSDTDDDQHPALAVHARKRKRSSHSVGSRVDAPVLLDSDEDSGKAVSKDVIDLDSIGASALSCGICGKEPPVGTFILSSCAHRFCLGCLSTHVNGKLGEALASEVGCPSCSHQLTVHELQRLSAPSSSHAAHPSASHPGQPNTDHAYHARAPSTAVSRVPGTPAATKRLMRELQVRTLAARRCTARAWLSSECEPRRQSLQRSASDELGLRVEVSGNLYSWDVEFFNFDKDTPLARDLAKVPGRRIVLRVAFPRCSARASHR